MFPGHLSACLALFALNLPAQCVKCSNDKGKYSGLQTRVNNSGIHPAGICAEFINCLHVAQPHIALHAVIERFSEFCYIYVLHHEWIEWMTPSETYTLLHARTVGLPSTLPGSADGCHAIRGYCAVIFSLHQCNRYSWSTCSILKHAGIMQTNNARPGLQCPDQIPRDRTILSEIIVPLTKIPDRPKSLW